MLLRRNACLLLKRGMAEAKKSAKTVPDTKGKKFSLQTRVLPHRYVIGEYYKLYGFLAEETVVIMKVADQTVCKGANIHLQGSDPVLKDKKDYPDWLWSLEDLYLKEKPLTMEHDQRRYFRQKNTLNIRARNKIMNIV